jgi:hypothetical protein
MDWATEVRFPGGASFQAGSEPTQSIQWGRLEGLFSEGDKAAGS